MVHPRFDEPKRAETGMGIARADKRSSQGCLDPLGDNERCRRFLRIAEEDRALADRSPQEFGFRGSLGFRPGTQIDLDRVQPDDFARRICHRGEQARPGCRVRFDTIIQLPSESGWPRAAQTAMLPQIALAWCPSDRRRCGELLANPRYRLIALGGCAVIAGSCRRFSIRRCALSVAHDRPH
jgi:hypothetical protein